MPTSSPHLSGIILAAGLSRRAAPYNKLLVNLKGRSVVRAVVEAFLGAELDEVLVVVGHEREHIENELKELPVRFVFAADYAKGMGCSIAAGVRQAAPGAQGFVISPADLPDLSTTLIMGIIQAFRDHRAEKHIIPIHNGARGHPVVVGAWLRSALEALQSDIGARGLLASEAEQVRCCLFPVNTPGILRDMDVIPTTPRQN